MRKVIDAEYLHLDRKGESNAEALDRLIELIGILRSECPWDKKQTHESLKKPMIEEAYEVCDAIDRDDKELLKEELGDVLLQVVFHSNLAEEEGLFTFKDVANTVSDKMIRRHPHIFLGVEANTIDKVREKWENVKRLEKLDHSTTQIMEAVPKSLPALSKSYKIQEKAALVGFDWDNIKDAFLKIEEEVQELKDAIGCEGKSRVEDELGDALFALVNMARFMSIDPEQALNKTSRRFIKRFSYIEKHAEESGRNLEDMTLKEMDVLWEQAKAKEK